LATEQGIEVAKNRKSAWGIQYAAKAYRERIEAYGICQSMSRMGYPYDNAVAENFFSFLKCERIHFKRYPTGAAAQNDMFALKAFIIPSIYIPPWPGSLQYTLRK